MSIEVQLNRVENQNSSLEEIAFYLGKLNQLQTRFSCFFGQVEQPFKQPAVST